MRDLIVQVIGEYSLQYDGEKLVGGLAGLDWPWLVGAGIFAMCLYCLLRLVGILLSRAFAD